MQIILVLAVLTSGFLQFSDAVNADPSLCVLLSVFSGRPDPQWCVPSSNPNYANIMEQYNAKTKGQTKTVAYMPSKLGYRGFLVKEDGTTTKQPDYIVGTLTTKLQQLLLQSIPKGKLNQEFIDTISEAIKKGVQLRSNPVPQTTKRYVLIYPDDSWNQPGVITKNRCYNYASDIKSPDGHTAAITGHGNGGQGYARLSDDAITAACVNDGFQVEQPGNGGSIPVLNDDNRHLVSLHVINDIDYHFYRLDSNGRWSHKPGIAPITDLDEDGAQIADPRNAKQNFYRSYHFVTFLSVNKNTASLRGFPLQNNMGCCTIL